MHELPAPITILPPSIQMGVDAIVALMEQDRAYLVEALEEQKRGFAALEKEFADYKRRTEAEQATKAFHMVQMQQNAESSKNEAVVAELRAQDATRDYDKLRTSCRRLKQSLEDQGLAFDGASETAVIRFKEDGAASRVVRDLCLDAKRRGHLPQGSDADGNGLQPTIADFVAVAGKLLEQADKRWAICMESLRLGRERGWTIDQWLGDVQRAAAAKLELEMHGAKQEDASKSATQ